MSNHNFVKSLYKKKMFLFCTCFIPMYDVPMYNMYVIRVYCNEVLLFLHER